jgi:hypothetical protein
MRRLKIDRFFREHMPRGKEGIGWAGIAKLNFNSTKKLIM